MYDPWRDEFVLLHLSDLHAGDPETWWCRKSGACGRELRYESTTHHELISAIEHLRPSVTQLDAIVVSGDIAYRAEPWDYEAASELLLALQTSLFRQFGKKPPIFLVPGNHDVNWSHDKNAVGCGADDRKRQAAMLNEYTVFAQNIEASGFIGIEKEDSTNPWLDLQPSTHTCTTPKSRAWLVGLNSCTREGHKPDQHYGYVGVNQVRNIFALRPQKVSPWDLQLAVFHHAVTLNSPNFPLTLNKLHDKNPADVESSLQGAEATLCALGENGVRGALYGHSHFDWPLHVTLPVADSSNPWEVGGITLFGGGSFGLHSSGANQIGPASAQVLRFRSHPADWEAMVQRIVFNADGRFLPHIASSSQKPRRIPLLSARSHNHYTELMAIAKSNPCPQPPSPPTEPKPAMFEISQWPRLGLGQKNGDILRHHGGPLEFGHRLAGGHYRVDDRAIARWAHLRPYNDVFERHVVKASKNKEGTIKLTVAIGRFYEVIGLGQFEAAENKHSVFFASRQGLGELLTCIQNRADRAVRLNMLFLGLVEKDQRTWLVLPRRSQNVALEPGKVSLTVGGGLRENHISDEEIKVHSDRDSSAFEIAFRREILLETGLETSGIWPVAIGLNRDTLAVDVLTTGWLQGDLEFFEGPSVGNVFKSKNGIDLKSAVLKANQPGRDRWEVKDWFALSMDSKPGQKYGKYDRQQALELLRGITKHGEPDPGEWTWAARDCWTFLAGQ